MTTFWLAFIEWFASVSALVAVTMTLLQMHGNRTHYAMLHYLSQCDAAIAYPQFANPELGELDLRSKTFDGEARQFERYEWHVARLVYTLDAAIRLAPFQKWRSVARTQLASHRHYFGSEYYKSQGYLRHYSPRMRKLIRQRAEAA